MLIEILGSLGALVILVVFLLNQLEKLKADNIYYDLLNFIGSFFLLLYALSSGAYPFIVVNFIWAAFSFKDIVKYFIHKK